MRFYEVVEKSKKNHYCEACRLVHSGPCYSCTTFSTAHTEYYLHEKSAKLPYEIQHPFHSSHPLILRTYHYRRGLIICDECRDVCRSLFYSCDECDFKLDVKCATLTTHKTDVLQPKKMESVAELNHFNHPHKLVFGNCSDPLWKESCTVCQLPIFGPAYYCLNFRCIFKVHEFCLGMPQKMQVPLHLKHMLCFCKSDKYSQCYACRKQINSVENNFDPDKNSAQREALLCLEPFMVCGLFLLVERYVVTRLRDVCFGFFYRCGECDFKLDVKCATLTAHKTEVENNTEAIDAFSSSELDFEENSAQVENNTAAIDAFSSSMSDFEESSDQWGCALLLTVGIDLPNPAVQFTLGLLCFLFVEVGFKPRILSAVNGYTAAGCSKV
ncbi:hypothetical protein QUC31_005875 [Theobroma cacao]